MGKVDESDTSWKEDRIFTGQADGYPAELFIDLIEKEATYWNYSESEMCSYALSLISSDNTAAGLWKSENETKLPSLSWAELKTELLDTFKFKDPYSLENSLELVLSLTKADSELFSTFLFRVEWVLESVLGQEGNQLLTKIFFLLGISEADKVLVLEKLNNFVEKTENLTAIASLLDDSKNLVLNLKQEPGDDAGFPDQYFGDQDTYLPGDPNDMVKVEMKPQVENVEEAAPAKKRKLSKGSIAKSGRVRKKAATKEGTQKGLKAWETHKLRAKLRVYQLAEHEDPTTVKALTRTFVAHENKTSKWYCGFCYQDFAKETEVKSHQIASHEGHRYQCDLCLDFKNRRLNAVAQHRMMAHDVLTDTFTKHTCGMSNCKFQTVEDDVFERHQRLVHSDEHAHLTQCNVCNRRFSSKDSLRKHIENIHMNMKKFSCEICDAGFATQAGLVKHNEKEHGGVKHRVCCPLCGKEYANEPALQYHIARIHPDNGAQYLPAHKRNQSHPCPECDKVFIVKADLQYHTKYFHSDDKWIQCSLCDKKLKNGSNYRNHFLSNHLKVTLKPFYCVQCSNSYTREKDCWIHVSMKHEGLSTEWSTSQWKKLRLEKPNLIEKRSTVEEENSLLKGHIDDKYLIDVKRLRVN